MVRRGHGPVSYTHLDVYKRQGLFGEMRRYPVDIAQVPTQVKQAFLAAEDANFYEHNGIDVNGVARALWLLAKTCLLYTSRCV